MNIIQIIPGSGGSFYCGNCLRDSKIVDALRKEGHRVVKIPMYLPLFSDEHDISDVPVFYGAVSIYLKQLFPFLRNAPRWFDRFLNSKALLKMAASMSGSTNAKGLEEMTVSMLLGEEGKQKEELETMIGWMTENCKPDVIHLSNALLLGLSHRIREKMNVPVVCSLQDEDVWVDVMKPATRSAVWKLMQERSVHVDLFVAVSRYFAEKMAGQMDLPAHKLKTVYLGVDPGEYEFNLPSSKKRNIGFISRLCHENGFDLAVDAFLLLKRDPLFRDVKLVVTGGSTAADAGFIRDIRRRIRKAGLSDEVDFHESFEGNGRTEFFRKVALGSVPVRNGEAFGFYLTELMASGIPVVQPALGAFPEIVRISAGGAIYEPNTPQKLAEIWAEILSDRNKLDELSIRARKGVEQSFNIRTQASEMVKIYQSLIK